VEKKKIWLLDEAVDYKARKVVVLFSGMNWSRRSYTALLSRRE
jgi:hypothetical protein